MRVGYACVHTELPTSSRTARLANATPERLRELTAANLDALEAILRWNAGHGIAVFRLSSNIVPLASHPVNELPWWDEHAERFAELGALMAREEMRLSTHPGQYTVLGSARPHVVDAALAEVEYQARLLAAFGLGPGHKIVVHMAGDPERFAAGVERLCDAARTRLVLENDERWSLQQVLEIAAPLALPVVFDVFHHELRPSLPDLPVREAVLTAAATWLDADGRPEVHFSTQAPGKRPGAHAESLDEEAFRAFAAATADLPLDCIVEVKDKERSALRAAALLEALPAQERA